MYSLLFVNATLLILYRGFNGGPHINDWSKFHCIIVSCLNFRSLSAVGESQLMIKMQVKLPYSLGNLWARVADTLEMSPHFYMAMK